MVEKTGRAALYVAITIGLGTLLVTPVMSQQQKGQQRQIYACADIHKRCVSRSSGQEVSACDGYYADAQRTGTWPAFRQSPAVSCKR